MESYQVIVHNQNYGTEKPSIICTNSYDNEPTEEEIMSYKTEFEDTFLIEVYYDYGNDNTKLLYTIDDF